MSLTSMLFRAARLSADGRAVAGGPGKVAKRAVRKTVYRHTSRVTRRALKTFGL